MLKGKIVYSSSISQKQLKLLNEWMSKQVMTPEKLDMDQNQKGVWYLE